MNKKDENPNYKRIYLAVNKKFKESVHLSYGPHDETYYTLRVYETAKDIIRFLNQKTKVQIILASAILHDVGKTLLDPNLVWDENGPISNAQDEWMNHSKLSVGLSNEILTELGHSKEFIEQVCFLVSNHDNRNIQDPPLSLQILQDADILADTGIAGFIRPFTFGGKFKVSILDSIKFLKEQEHIDNQVELLNLDVSKKLFQKLRAENSSLVKLISNHLNSDLLK